MITSIRNPKIQFVRRLLSSPRERREAQAFVVEGVRLVEEAQLSGWQPQLVFYTDDLSPRGRAVVDRFAARGVPIEQVARGVLEAASDMQTPQGVLAVLSLQTLPLPPEPHLVLIADAVRDPGNLGAILRTASAAGAQAVLLPPSTADAYAPKVVRAAMGAHFRLPIHRLDWDEIRAYLAVSGGEMRPRVYLADAGEGLPFTQADFRSPLALIVGGEAEGASVEAQKLADDRVHIPMPGHAESLNVAAAAAVLLFEVVRQREVSLR